jgi:hypothetical protein
MAMDDELDLRAVVQALALYLQANPHACDTADGIRRWWLSPEVECTHDAVVLALDWMERRNVIELTTAADGRQRFRRTGSDEQLVALFRALSGGQTVP